MNSEIRHILLSLYTALVYPFSGTAIAVSIVMLIFENTSDKAIGLVLILSGVSSMILYRKLRRRKSDVH